MTIPALSTSTVTKHATSDESLFEIKKEEKKFLPTAKQRHARKRIASFKTIENTQSTSTFSVEEFLTNLPEALKVELNSIQRYCTLNNNLTKILNGHGIFYNRLIILLKRIDLIMTENGFSDKHKTKVEEKINQLLTEGKLNLLSDIGRELNHLEEYYDTGSWLPAPEDIPFFDQDDKNCNAQHQSGDFCPEWMKKTEIDPKIPASKAMLAYWNFRHSFKNAKRNQLTDLIVSKLDPELFRFICKLRKLKAALHNPAIGTPSSPPGLTRFHIDAIAARFDYADTVANRQAKTNPAYKLYFWDNQSPCTEEQESMQQSETGEAAGQTLNGIVEDSPDASTCNFVEEGNKPIHQTTDRSLRKRRSYPNYQEIFDDQLAILPKKRKKKKKKKSTFSSSSTANKFPRMDKENLLKETGIPAFEKIIKSVLEQREKELIPDPTSAPLEESVEASYHRDRAEVIAAQDELSRLYDACRQHFGINKSLYRFDTVKKSVSITPKEDRTNDRPGEVYIPKPNKPPYTDKPPTHMSTAERKPDFSEAQNAFITMIEKSKELSLKPIIEPERLRGHSEDFGYAPTRQPLSTVLKLPMPFLTKFFAIEGNTNPEATIKLKERVPELIEEIKMIIRLYRHNSNVWCPDDAREMLNPVIQKVREVQHCFPQIIHAFENRQQDLLKSSHHTTEDINSAENQLEKIQEALAKTAIVLSSLEDFSAHLKTEKQQELYQRLVNTIEEWRTCIANTPESLLPAVRQRVS
ncbi:hypothetical protein J7438_18950 [Thalassotalea sp. G20_0]|uniref:hypothetical protein n=1 Tax=Thalassotalea sp. G20_0 TaxID=2821093 RepID=UPI001ADCC89B|nr:hypothetical protein [Thalassotalea sp. G20_0]MBO9496143.1 hypothetical protein [Thalassotalea sp. G20_0]